MRLRALRKPWQQLRDAELGITDDPAERLRLQRELFFRPLCEALGFPFAPHAEPVLIGGEAYRVPLRGEVCNAKGEPWLWILQEKVGTDGNPIDPDLRDYILLRSALGAPSSAHPGVLQQDKVPMGPQEPDLQLPSRSSAFFSHSSGCMTIAKALPLFRTTRQELIFNCPALPLPSLAAVSGSQSLCKAQIIGGALPSYRCAHGLGPSHRLGPGCIPHPDAGDLPPADHRFPDPPQE